VQYGNAISEGRVEQPEPYGAFARGKATHRFLWGTAMNTRKEARWHARFFTPESLVECASTRRSQQAKRRRGRPTPKGRVITGKSSERGGGERAQGVAFQAEVRGAGPAGRSRPPNTVSCHKSQMPRSRGPPRGSHSSFVFPTAVTPILVTIFVQRLSGAKEHRGVFQQFLLASCAASRPWGPAADANRGPSRRRPSREGRFLDHADSEAVSYAPTQPNSAETASFVNEKGA